jgi:hypothetical protein
MQILCFSFWICLKSCAICFLVFLGAFITPRLLCKTNCLHRDPHGLKVEFIADISDFLILWGPVFFLKDVSFLAKSGYKPYMKRKTLIIFLYFWLHAWAIVALTL